MAQWINFNQKNTDPCERADILYWEENCPYPPTASGSYGRQVQAGRQADEIQVEFEIFKILYRLNYSGCYFVYPCKCYYSIRTAFQYNFVK